MAGIHETKVTITVADTSELREQLGELDMHYKKLINCAAQALESITAIDSITNAMATPKLAVKGESQPDDSKQIIELLKKIDRNTTRVQP